MTIREKIARMPVWKAIIVVLFGIFLLSAVIDEVVVSRVFSIMNHMVDRFDVLFKADDKELAKDSRDFDEKQEFDNAQIKIQSDEINEDVTETYQQYNCNHKNRIKKFEALLSLPYVKHNKFEQNAILDQISFEQQFINKSIKEHSFDPAQCKENL